MTSIDIRTRFDGDDVAIDPATWPTDVAAQNDANGTEAFRAFERMSLPTLTLLVDGEPITIAPTGDRLEIRAGRGGDLIVELGVDAFGELVEDVVSTFGVQMTARAALRSGTVDDWIAWEPVLRTLLDGRRSYTPGMINFEDRSGAPLDLGRSFTLDDDPAEVGHFLTQAGYLHLRGVFTAEEMAAVNADHDAAIAASERYDGRSWWARTDDDKWYPARLLGFDQQSSSLRDLLADERFRRLRTFTDDDFVARHPESGDSAEALDKRVGVVEGVSDVSWHKDCSMGGHTRRCNSLTVGISVTGAGPTTGELGVVPGSHRANIPALGVVHIDLARRALPTETGDGTIHCSCTLHMSRPPVTAGRRVVYTGFDLAARDEDRRPQADPATARANRQALDEHLKRRQGSAEAPSTRTASFDL